MTRPRTLSVPVREGTVYTATWVVGRYRTRGVVQRFRVGGSLLELRMELSEFERHLRTLNTALPQLRRELSGGGGAG
jgi:hypothetical protein